MILFVLITLCIVIFSLLLLVWIVVIREKCPEGARNLLDTIVMIAIAIIAICIVFCPAGTTEKTIQIEKYSDGEYFSIGRNSLLYYAKTENGVEQRQINSSIKKEFILGENETPYIAFNEYYNVLGMDTFLDGEITVFLPKK